MNYQNIARAKAIEQENKKRLLKLNPKLNDKSGIGENMKYISNAKYEEPVETGTIYRGDNKRLDICVHTLCGCGETLYMNCRALGIVNKRLNSTSVIGAINEAQSLAKRELDLLNKELNVILNSDIEISRY